VALVVSSPNKLPLAISQNFPSNVDAGSQVTAKVTVTPNYSGTVNVTCDATAMAGAICTVSPANTVPVTAGVSTSLTISLSVPNTAALNPTNSYTINLTVSDSSGQPSNTLVLPLNVIQDFSVNSATPGQTVTAGQTTGAYQLSIAPNPSGSSFPGAVTLSCPDGLPSGAQCKFTPNPITPASGGPDVVMTIATAGPTGSLTWPARHRSTFYALWLMLPGIVIAWGSAERKLRRGPRIACTLTVLALMALTLASCGGGTGSSGGGGPHPTTSITYTVTVQGLSGTISHSTSVILIVQ
jgi:hypothetical protein